MAGARVWDRRCVENLVKIAEKLAAKQESSFCSAVGHAGRQAAHRICSKEETSVQDLLQGHIAQTAARCGQYELVLVDQDTTTADYSTHQQTTGLGPVNTHHSPGICPAGRASLGRKSGTRNAFVPWAIDSAARMAGAAVSMAR